MLDRWKTMEVSEDDIHAYVDRELPLDKLMRVEAAIFRDPELRAKADAFQQQANALQAAFGQMDLPPMPAETEAMVEQLAERLQKRQSFIRYSAIAAGFVISVALGASSGYLLQPSVPKLDTLAEFRGQAERARDFASEFETSLQTPATEVRAQALRNALTTVMQTSASVPNLSAHSLKIVNWQNVITTTGRAIHIDYAGEDGHRVSLYTGTAKPWAEAGFNFARRNEVSYMSWLEGTTAFALIGDLPEDRMVELAAEVSAQLKAPMPVIPAPNAVQPADVRSGEVEEVPAVPAKPAPEQAEELEKPTDT